MATAIVFSPFIQKISSKGGREKIARRDSTAARPFDDRRRGFYDVTRGVKYTWTTAENRAVDVKDAKDARARAIARHT